MKNLQLTVHKAQVLQEMAKQTSYIGAHVRDDETAYMRIFTTDADRELLESFWDDCCAKVTSLLSRFMFNQFPHDIKDGDDLGDDFILHVRESRWFDLYTVPAVEQELMSFFVQSMLGRWMAIVQPEMAEGHASLAVTHLEAAGRLMSERKRPLRGAGRKSNDNNDGNGTETEDK